MRFAQHQEFVIGGFKPNAANFDSLLVGYYEGRKLMCAGKVRSGFTPHLRAQVFDADSPSRRRTLSVREPADDQERPLGRRHHRRRDEGAALGEAGLVVEVSFAEWTRDGSLRHAAFVALRDDKAARDVTR